MFQKLYFLAMLFISIIILSFNQLYAQEEEGEVIIISEKVGEMIDKEEMNMYKVFQGVKGLESVVFLKLPDGDYVLKTTYIDEITGKERVEITPITESIIKTYSSTIDKFEEIQAREYQDQQTVSADSSKEKKIYITFRTGIGGSNQLGGAAGGALDIKLSKLPITISWLSEAYRRMPLVRYYAEPDDAFYGAINVYYTVQLYRSKTPFKPLDWVNLYLGGGLGGLELYKYERTEDRSWRDEPYAIEESGIYNLEAGINIKLLGPLGVYVAGKYLYAKKKRNGVKVIDINCTSWLFGLSFNFGLFDKAKLRK